MLKNAGVWVGGFLLIYSGVLFQQSLTLDYYNPMGPGPGFLPLWLSGILFLVSLLYMWSSIRGEFIPVAIFWPSANARADIFLMLGGLCLFALLVEYIGFVIAASQLVFLMTFRKFKWYYALPASIFVSVLVLVAFQNALGVPLPVNEFGF